MDSLFGLNRGLSTKTEVSKKQQKEYKLVGKIRRVAGHTLFSFNTKTKEIKVADMNRNVCIGVDLKPKYLGKILIEKDCIYVQALNKKNAVKILRREGVYEEAQQSSDR